MTFVGCGTRNQNREFPAIGSVISITVLGHCRSPEPLKIIGKAAIAEIVTLSMDTAVMASNHGEAIIDWICMVLVSPS